MLGRMFVALPYQASWKLSSTIVEMDSLSAFGAATGVPHQSYDADVLPGTCGLFRGLELNATLTQRQEQVGSHDNAQVNQPPERTEKCETQPSDHGGEQN